MKFGVVNKSTILNRFVLYILQRNITHLAVITRKTNIKLGILKGGNWKRAQTLKQTCQCDQVNKFKQFLALSHYSSLVNYNRSSKKYRRNKQNCSYQGEDLNVSTAFYS